jgi:hypothetical protein
VLLFEVTLPASTLIPLSTCNCQKHIMYTSKTGAYMGPGWKQRFSRLSRASNLLGTYLFAL